MKPGDFLLSVLDFFSTLLPGSLATWLVTQYLPTETILRALSFGLGDGKAIPDQLILVSAFLLSSYVLGHFVFMAAAELDSSYDRWRKRTKPPDRDTAYKAAEKLHRDLTGDLVGGGFTTLKWARTYVQIHSAGARLEIDQFEANQKFFRSLVVVSIAFAAHFFLHERQPAAGLIAVVFAVLSYHRYCDQRWKMTELSYATAVILHATKAGTEDENNAVQGRL